MIEQKEAVLVNSSNFNQISNQAQRQQLQHSQLSAAFLKDLDKNIANSLQETGCLQKLISKSEVQIVFQIRETENPSNRY